MKNLTITAIIKVFQFEELTPADQELIHTAKDATNKSYSPYSNFAVGAALRLKNGTIVTGSNQENAAYPSGLCAERTALFYANSEYKDQPVETIAVAARNQKGFLNKPIPPCGSCRQVMLETENRFNHPLRILLYGTDEIYEIKGSQDLLPLSFSKTNMDD